MLPWEGGELRLSFEIVYFFVIAFALLNYGAVDLLVVSLLALPIFTMLAILLMKYGFPKHTLSVTVLATSLLCASGLWIFLQTTPLPIEILSNPAWVDVKALADDVGAVISVTPADDRAAWLRIAAPFGVFLVGLFLFPTDDHAERALMIMGLASGFVALCSMLQFSISPDRLLLGPKVAYLDSLTGFFVNRNTASTFFGLSAILNTALFFREARGLSTTKILGIFERRVFTPLRLRRQLIWTTAFAVASVACYVALMLTKSRAGIGSAFVGTILQFVLMSFRRSTPLMRLRRPRSRRQAVTLAVLSILTIAVLFLSIGGQVLFRAQLRGVEDARFCVLPGVWSAIKESFPFGTGLASFIEVFPAYRDPACGIVATWDMAHNFYFEGLITFGAAFPILYTVALVGLIYAFVIGLKRRRTLRYCAETGLASLTIVTLHSAFDFSLQISGFAIFLAMLIAPLVTCSLRPPVLNKL